MKILHIDEPLVLRQRKKKSSYDLIVLMTQEEYNKCAYYLEKDKRKEK